MMKGQFTLEDYAAQLRQITRMGSLSGILGMLPGVGEDQKSDRGRQSRHDDPQAPAGDHLLDDAGGERVTPAIVKASRKRRIAAGSGTSVQEVNRLLKQFDDMSGMLKRVNKLGEKGLMRHGLGARPATSTCSSDDPIQKQKERPAWD